MVSSVITGMKSVTKPRLKKRPATSKRIISSPKNDSSKRYLALILSISLLNFCVCSGLLVFTMFGGGWGRGGSFETVTQVPADPSTGLILPQKPIKVDISPSEVERGASAIAKDADVGAVEDDKGWLPKEENGGGEKKKTDDQGR